MPEPAQPDINEDPAMLDNLLSTARRRQLGVCGALLAASVLAACDNNEPTSPAATPKATAANASRGGQIQPAVISWKMLDEKNAVVKYDGAMFEVSGPYGYHKIFYDNSYPEDGDPALGQVKLVGMNDGQYKICQVDVAMGFTLLPASQCFSGYLGVGAQLTFTFFNPRPPYVQWDAVTDVGTLLGGGATFTVKDSLGSGPTVTDDQWPDNPPQPGALQIGLAHPGTWTICETQAPAGYLIPAGQPCSKVVVNWGDIGWGGSFVNSLPYSMNWGVTEGVVDANNNYVPLGGAKFTVQYGRSLSKTSVDDNGQNDYDPRPGRIAMKLGAAGTYTVCEVQAPANHWLPKPPCKTVSVAYATPAFVGWFITPESQVIYNP
jgi:hypothetical protein